MYKWTVNSSVVLTAGVVYLSVLENDVDHDSFAFAALSLSCWNYTLPTLIDLKSQQFSDSAAFLSP